MHSRHFQSDVCINVQMLILILADNISCLNKSKVKHKPNLVIPANAKSAWELYEMKLFGFAFVLVHNILNDVIFDKVFIYRVAGLMRRKLRFILRL